MGLFPKYPKTDAPQAESMSTSTGRKRIRLHSGSLSREAISAATAETLRAGGWVEPSTTPASVVDPPEPKIGDKMPDGTVLAWHFPRHQQAARRCVLDDDVQSGSGVRR